MTIDLAATAPDEEARVEMGGIGAVLAPRADALDIVTITVGGGAADAGLAPGDEIVAIEGARVTDLGFAQAVQRIRGPEGSAVALGVRRSGEEPEVVVVVARRLVRTSYVGGVAGCSGG